MRRPTAVLSVLAALLPVVLAAPVQAESHPATSRTVAAEAVDFVFIDRTRQQFVIRLTDADKIKDARRVLSGAETGKVHVLGRIAKQQATYNPGWSYHLTSDTISFFDEAPEFCDASIDYVEDHLDEVGGAFLPGGHWCPWDSRLVRELD